MALAFKIPAAKEMTEFALAKFKKSSVGTTLPVVPGLRRAGAQPCHSNRHDRRPAVLPELRFEFLHQRFAGGNVFHDGKRRRAAAGHERGQRAVCAQKFLEQREHGIFFQRRRFERIVKFSVGGAQITGLKL